MAIAERRNADAVGGTGAVAHIAAVARAMSLMGPIATAMSTQQRATPHEASGIRRLLPALVQRYGLVAECEYEGELLTVTFERDRQ